METASISSTLFKWSIGIAIVWGVWFLLLKQINQFSRVRLFIIIGVLLSMAAPFLSPLLLSMAKTSATSLPFQAYLSIPELTINPSGQETNFSLSAAALYIVAIGSALLLFRILISLIRILTLIKTGKLNNCKSITIVEHNKSIPPFSFFSYCFVNPSSIPADKMELIVAHEIAHKKNGHSLDQVLMELIGVTQWFNPFYWMLKKSLIEIHEYQADGEVIAKSADSEKYMDSIVSVAFSGIALSLGNNFNKSLTIKRLAMMNTKKVKKHALPALVLSFLLVFTLVFTISCDRSETKISNVENETITTKSQETVEEDVFKVVENMPKFRGDKSHEMFRNYIAQNLKYPVIAFENGIQGKVFVSFIIEPDGSVSNVKVVKGVDPSIDKEAVRVVESSPKWEPGTQRGVNVRVQLTFPISFSLEK
ncbi:MAG: M56 family metallopeptidase [Bacteroidales bacterium]|nr:M56 family metallopeptidase [Bacteroidales bacterium]MDD3892325.1 M56 family metallopeptidase [Bacteroidales bacterium]